MTCHRSSLPRVPVALPVVLVVALALLTGCPSAPPGSSEESADLVVVGGPIATVDEENSVATGLAAVGDRIVYVGTEEEARRRIGKDTRVVELDGRLAIPGFVEGHGHFFGLGQSRLMLDLRSAQSWGEMVDLVAEAAAETPAGSWIEGRGWHQDKWSEAPESTWEGVPGHGELSAVSPDHPVLLTHASGHASMVNARALELAGIDEGTPDPEGGEIVRNDAGEPTGYLRETAQGLISSVRDSSFDEDRARRVVELAGEECLRKGVTSFQDAGSPVRLVDFYAGMADRGELPVRLWVMLRDDNSRLREHGERLRSSDLDAPFFAVGGIKKSIDGALGAHGAWLLEPYTDLPSSRGLNTTPLSEIEEAAEIAREHDYQLCVHAIGDRANRETLDLFERAMGEDLRTARWRIEHAQHLHPDDIPRFGRLGVVASMQGVHCTSDGPWVPDRLGEERTREGAYVWRSLLDSGAVVSNGTDAPVEDVDPLASWIASVTRRMANGEKFHPEQAMSRTEALRSYTIDAAWAARQESSRGSLEPGKLADLVVLSHDLLSVPEERLPETRVEMTLLGGSVVFDRSEISSP